MTKEGMEYGDMGEEETEEEIYEDKYTDADGEVNPFIEEAEEIVLDKLNKLREWIMYKEEEEI